MLLLFTLAAAERRANRTLANAPLIGSRKAAAAAALKTHPTRINACYRRAPRECGPVVIPGAHTFRLLQPSAQVPPNILFINVTQRNQRVLVCVPAKGGSTSFYFWLYQMLAGCEWPYRGPPWVQELSSWRWRQLNMTAQVKRLASLGHVARRRVLADTSVGRFALLRHPLERALSAYFSKVACERTGDMADHARMVRNLMRQAPKAAAQLDPRSLPPPRQSRAELRVSVPPLKTNFTPCLTMLDWSAMVAEVVSQPEMRPQLDVHFLPQADSCGLRDVGYHHIVPLEDNAEGMAALAAHLSKPNEARQPLKKRHLTTRMRNAKGLRAPGLDARVASNLRLAFADDIELLNYPNASA